MYFTEVLETAIGLVFVFLAVSIAASGIQEFLASLLRWRAKDLESAVRAMLQESSDEEITRVLINHPLLRSFNKHAAENEADAISKGKGWNHLWGNKFWPTYIPARTFALALMDLVVTAGTDQSMLQAGLNRIKIVLKNFDGLENADALRGEFENLVERIRELDVNRKGILANEENIQQQVDRKVAERSITRSSEPGFTPSVENIQQDLMRTDPAFGDFIEAQKRLQILADIKAFAIKNVPPAALKEIMGYLEDVAWQEGMKVLQDKKPALRQVLDGLYSQAAGEVGSFENRLSKARENIETWFNDTMDRVSGWYKRNALYVMFAAGFGLAVFFNVDTIAIAKALWTQPALRVAVAAQAEQYVEDAAAQPAKDGEKEVLAGVRQQMGDLAGLGLPVGWPVMVVGENFGQQAGGWFLKVLGWLVTGAAASQGSPFWFDLLQKLVNVRSAGKKPEGGTK